MSGPAAAGAVPSDPLWYKDAIIYELHVKAFHDSNDDGVGDFRGLMRKLDYLEDLGVTAIWLLPFYPSPLRDDGYDIADYYQVHPDYGQLRDFRAFLGEAHRRGLRVITELVMNHTSDQHAWFQRARRAPPGSRWRDFYVWSDTPDRYREARIIFKDFEPSNWTFDRQADQYFWHRFYSHQPDLNFDNPEVRQSMFRVLDFWLGMGVDGLRLDAVPYLYEREGTNCENLAETHAYLRELRAYVDAHYPERMLLAEANQWPEDAVAYFGAGDMCHMAFHFPLMPRMYMALQQEDRFPILDILDQTPAIPENCQWALFLRNHDELTLEMVTDEERDYMYRVYAKDSRARINLGIRRRLAPLLSNDRDQIELMNILLFSLPGTPVIYYGDEIGMGDNFYLGDRNGVRTPMQWNYGKNAGFSEANPQSLYLPVIIDPEYHYEALNVETQERNPASLLWWMKRAIAVRRRHRAFSRGSLEFLYPANPKILAFLRVYGEEVMLVAVNLSRFAQAAELDLPRYAGSVPEELFSRTRFPALRAAPYLLTFGPYGCYVFRLQQQAAGLAAGTERPLPRLRARAGWRAFPEEDGQRELETRVLPAWLPGARWFGEKTLSRRAGAHRGEDPRPGGRGVRAAADRRGRVQRGGEQPVPAAAGLRLRREGRPAAGERAAGHPGPARAAGHGGDRLRGPSDDAFCLSLLRLIVQHRRVVTGARRAGDRAVARAGTAAAGEGAAPGRQAGGHRAEQQLHHLREPADPEAVPAAGGRGEHRRGAHPLPEREGRFPLHPPLPRSHRVPPRAVRPHLAGAAAGVRAQRGGLLDLHPEHPGPPVRADPGGEAAPPGRGRPRGGTGKPHRLLLRRDGPAAGAADRRDAPRPRLRDGRPGLRPRALHQPLPALGVPVAAGAHPPLPAGPGPAAGEPGPGRPGHGAAGARPGEGDPGAPARGGEPQDLGAAHPHPRRLPPGAGPVHRQGLRASWTSRGSRRGP